MASTLCVTPRRDVRVAPGIVDPPSEILEAEPSPQVVDLMRLMHATSLDAVESATNSDIELSSSTVYAARAVKLNNTARTVSAEQGRRARRQAQHETETSTALNEASVAGLTTLHSTTTPYQLNISVAVLPTFESDGIATHLVSHVLEVAFEKLNSHRIQARIVHSSVNPAQTGRAVSMFLYLGFVHEGVRRRAVVHPTEGRWSDVTVLAMLDLDWFSRLRVAPLKGTLWDEMFVRHQRDRDIILRMEGSQGQYRTGSMQTTRDLWSTNNLPVRFASTAPPSVAFSWIPSDTVSQGSAHTAMSGWDVVSNRFSSHTIEVNEPNVASTSSEDDTADEDEDWDFDEYCSEDENNKV